MEKMEKSTTGIKIKWCAIGAIIAIIAGFLIWGTQPSEVIGERREISRQDVAVYTCNGLIRVLVFNPNTLERITTIEQIHQAQFFSDETSFTNAILGLEASGCSPVVTRLIREEPTVI